MSKEVIQMVYRGDAVAEHSMDVEQLAPALMAIGELCREANNVINADRSKIHVLVKSDFEGGCFDINLEVVQTIYEQVKSLLQDPRIATAKEILEWLGLFGIPGGALWFLKKRRARNLISVVKNDADGTVEVQIEGEPSPTIIEQNVFQLSENMKILKSFKVIVAPTQAPGIDSVEFRSDKQTHEKIDKEDAEYIIRTEIDQDDEEIEPQTIDAVLTIYAPVFDVKSTAWRFYYGEEVIRVDMGETSIPQDTINRGGIKITDAYKVRLQITQRRTESGRFKNDYKIVELLKFVPGGEQQRLPFDLTDKKDGNDKTED